MKANELRIGNFVDVKGHWQAKVSLIGDGIVQFYGNEGDFVPDMLYGIPLTEEWLVRLGFEEYKEDSWLLGEVSLYFVAEYIGLIGCNFKHKNISYVHQLQNLYFALTGEELKEQVPDLVQK